MTTIAELFVNLGVKGTDKTVGALGGVKQGLKDTASLSLEAKAGIIGAMYALEQLFSASGKAGTNLTNLSATLGVNMQSLQQYQYAARQVGVSNEEVAGTFAKLQTVATNIFLGKGVPEGLDRVAKVTGLRQEEAQRLFLSASQGHPEQLIQKLQEYAKLETNEGLKNKNLGELLTGGGVTAVSRQAFRPEVLARAPTISDKEIATLDRVHAAWSNIEDKIQKVVDHFAAMHGEQLTADISKIVDKVAILAKSFMELAEATKLFTGIQKAFEGWTIIIDGLIKLINVAKEGYTLLTGGTVDPKKSEAGKLEKGVTEFFKSIPGVFDAMIDSLGDTETPLRGAAGAVLGEAPKAKAITPGSVASPAHRAVNALIGEPPKGVPTAQAIAPSMPGVASAAAPGQNIEVTQTLNFEHTGTDPKKTADSVKQAVRDAFRQMPAQAQGS